MSAQPKNIIYCGVPGTGKTYQLQQLMKHYTDTIGHNDFAQQALTALSWREVICLVLLKENRLLKINEIAQHAFVTLKNKNANSNVKNNSIVPTITNELHRFSNPDSTTIDRENINYASNHFFDKDESGAWFIMVEAKKQLENLTHKLSQINSSMSTTGMHINRYIFVSFHQSYGYEEFVEGLKPVIDAQSKQITYQIQQGAFVQLCETARKDPQNKYAVFIDEINRANVSKVFGELLSLIEANKRQGKTEELGVKLAYSGRYFSVPSNVDIYATMNMADRSLTPLDVAMRRRFKFITLLPQPELLPTINDVNLAHLLTALNIRITALLGQDYVLGHANFMAINTLTELNELMVEEIIPLLQEYCFGDWQQIRTILADDQKLPMHQFLVENELAHQLNLSSNLYQVNPNMLQLNSASYLPIYQPLENMVL